MDVCTSRPGGPIRQGVISSEGRIRHRFHYAAGSRCRGYTLIELMVTVAVLVLLFSVALPGLRSMLTSNRIATHVNHLVGDLALTRSEAVTRGVDAVMCTSDDGRRCVRQGGWEQGWIVFADRNGNRQHDIGEAVAHVQGALSNGYTLRYAAFGSRHYVVFFPNGFTRTNGTFTVCDADEPSSARAVVLSKVGRPRLARTRPDGSALPCPP